MAQGFALSDAITREISTVRGLDVSYNMGVLEQGDKLHCQLDNYKLYFVFYHCKTAEN